MRLKIALSPVALLLLVTAWFVFAWRWSYSDGERAGWVQKFSRKGWVCKTWEGEQALVSLPGTASVEKFFFTVHDEATAQAINKLMGRRVNLHYEEKVGLPGSCFGETRYFVTGVTLVDEISLSPGVVVPVPTPPASAASQ
ncbi:hypothetical protein [Roseateles sp.]|uniref:hypothetical protein n=1 Tax=Roseateles sp. TaxID=1971397 RepID=UPI003267713E